jgi:hypothetical protein
LQTCPAPQSPVEQQLPLSHRPPQQTEPRPQSAFFRQAVQAPLTHRSPLAQSPSAQQAAVVHAPPQQRLPAPQSPSAWQTAHAPPRHV